MCEGHCQNLKSSLCSFCRSKPSFPPLLKGLSPAFLRLGGIKNNHQIFSDDANELYKNISMNPRLTSFTSERQGQGQGQG